MVKSTSTSSVDGHLKELMNFPDFSLREWLSAATDAKLDVPQKLAMKLLDFGSTKEEWQEVITEFLGDSGRAIGAQKSKWMYVLPFSNEADIGRQWASFDLVERQYLLKWLRKNGSQDCWKLLSDTWTSLKPAQKVALLKPLREAISPSDEPHLESLLDDPSKDVSLAAGNLLSLISESAHSRRAFSLALELFNIERESTTFVWTFPSKYGRMLESDIRRGFEILARDGVNYNLVLELIVSNVSPENWCSKFGMTAEELICLTKNTQVAERKLQDCTVYIDASAKPTAFLNGCYQSTLRFRDEDFAVALIRSGSDYSYQQFKTVFDNTKLTQLLKPTSREKLARQLYAENKDCIFNTDGDSQESHQKQLFLEVLKSCRHVWSEDFSSFALEALKSQCSRATDNHEKWLINTILADFACFVSPKHLDDSVVGWKETEELMQALNKFRRRIQFRKEFLREIENSRKSQPT